MPNIKSANKRVRIIAAKTARNQALRSALRTQIKKALVAVETNAEDRDLQVRTAIKKIDQAVAKGILHKKNAAMEKYVLAKKLGA